MLYDLRGEAEFFEQADEYKRRAEEVELWMKN